MPQFKLICSEGIKACQKPRGILEPRSINAILSSEMADGASVLSPAREIFERFVKGGLAAVEASVATKEWENGLLDFKLNCDRRSGDPTDVPTSDTREQFGELLSAFANTKGGVCIWGVERKGDKADLKPLPRVATFVQAFEEQISGLTDPPVTGIENRIIHQESDGSGYVATFVPQSPMMPHLCIAKKKINTFFMRSGSSCEPMPLPYIKALLEARSRPLLRMIRGRQEVAYISAEHVKAHYGGAGLERHRFEYVAHMGLINDGEALAENVAVTTMNVEGLRWRTLVSPSIEFKFPAFPQPQSAWHAVLERDRILYPGVSTHFGALSYEFYLEQAIPIQGSLRPPEILDFWVAFHARNHTNYQHVIIDTRRLILPETRSRT